MDVWVVESGDYEDRGVYGVFSSPEAAVESLRNVTYAAPYIVEWTELRREDDENASLEGKFSAVMGKSTAHTAFFDLRRWTLDAAF